MTKWKAVLSGLLGVAVVALVGGTMTSQARPAGGGGAYTVTVSSTTDGTTESTIGANEGCARFNVSDLTDAGFTNYRIYAGMSRVEPQDDDGVFGSPSIAQIESGGPSTINWTQWNTEFTRSDGYFWTGCSPTPSVQVSLQSMLSALKANNIKPIIVLRPVDNNGGPSWASALNPPTTAAAQNEWWEFAYAWVYYADVTLGLNIDDWEVHNEPDNSSQGWGGTEQDYMDFTRLTSDAIHYVYSHYLPGRTPKVYAPVSTHANNWISDSLNVNDDVIDVVDWHRYGPPLAEAQEIQGWINQYNSDGIHEPLMLSEWGSYRGAYGLNDGINYAGYLLDHDNDTGRVDESSVFPMYDWTSNMTGLVHGDGTRAVAYYAFRLMNRGINGSKTQYVISTNIPSNVSARAFTAKDAAGTVWTEVLNSGAQSLTFTVDLSALGKTTGTVTFHQFSSSQLDTVTGTGTLSGGKVTFAVPAHSIVQVQA
jgi:hypothetical protein